MIVILSQLDLQRLFIQSFCFFQATSTIIYLVQKIEVMFCIVCVQTVLQINSAHSKRCYTSIWNS